MPPQGIYITVWQISFRCSPGTKTLTDPTNPTQVKDGGYTRTTSTQMPDWLELSSIQFTYSVLYNSVTPWTPACQASLSITNSQVTQTHVHRVIDTIQPSHPLSSPSPPALNLSQHQGLFKWVSSSHRVAKVFEFQLQHPTSPSNEHQGLISLGWTDRISLLAVQGTLKSLLQHQSSKASILQGSAFFTVQLSHPYTTTGKTIAWLDRLLLAK